MDVGLPYYVYGAHGQPLQKVNGFLDRIATLMKMIDSQSSNSVYLHMRVLGHNFLYSCKKMNYNNFFEMN